MNQNTLIQITTKWSEGYTKGLKEATGNDLSTVNIIEDDWDTRFMWLATHLWLTLKLPEIYPDVDIEYIFENGNLISIYGILVTNTISILEEYGVKEIDAITMIPNFFIRHYDYLIIIMGALCGRSAKDIDMNQYEGWFAIKASDFLNQE